MRKSIPLNKGWTFYKGEGGRARRVTLPHTWNNLDGQDGGNDYYRGECRYERTLPEIRRGETDRLYLDVPAAGLNAEVLLDGVSVKRHEGGFTRFRADISQARRGSKLTIRVDNAERAHVYPQFADFTFCGGLYRGVGLLIVPQSRISVSDFGGPGVKITPKLDERRERAAVTADVQVTNPKSGQQVRVELLAADGTIAAQAADNAAETVCLTLTLDKPRLWNGVDDPYLYTARVSLLEGGASVDALEIPFGVRDFAIDPEKGFLLNGRPYPLRGVSRHQDRQDKGWAISRADQQEDMALICEVGANTVRLAHYPHDEYFYDLCDRKGMIVWAEIPYISRHVPAGRENTISQMTEMVRQLGNHPCIVCWGLSNEITINGVSEDLLENHRILNDLCHRLDPSRLTTMACVSMLETGSPLLRIPDILSYNHYFGWYGASVEDNAPWLDEFHKAHPEICLGLSEYGAEAVLRWHTDTPKMGDYSEEYQAYYHRRMLETFETRPYLWSTHVWNMFDFASDMRDEGGVKGRNNKGLVTFDRRIKKDSFYLYKAWWSKEPFVHIAGRRYRDRTGESARILVYSNQSEVELLVNGHTLAKQRGARVFAFEVPLQKFGLTVVTAKAGACGDKAAFRRVKKPNREYSLETASGAGANWFDPEGKPVVLDYPEGYFSIRDSIGDILQSEAGRALLEPLMKKALEEYGGGGFASGSQMQKMLNGFSLERLIKLSGGKFEPSAILELNRALNRIPKK